MRVVPVAHRRYLVTILVLGMLGVIGLPSTGAMHAYAAHARSWRPQATLPAPAEGVTAIRLPDGSVLALGGDAAAGADTRMAARLLPGSSAWIRLPSAPVDLATPSALALSIDSVVVTAPAFASGNLAKPSSALLLDPLTGTWAALPVVPAPLLAPVLLRLDSQHVLALGAVGGAVGAVLNLQARTWTTVLSPVQNLASYTAVMLPGRGAMILVSVVLDSSGRPTPVRQGWLLTPQRRWHRLAGAPIQADGAQAALLDGDHVLFAGGRPLADDPRAAAPPALLYDVQNNTWSVAGSTGQNHRGGQLVALAGGRAILVGGHDAGGTPSTECLLFDAHSWRATASLPGPWAGYAVVAVSSTSVLLIGGDRPHGSSIDAVADTIVWSLDPAPVG